jgi:hypothetical protein
MTKKLIFLIAILLPVLFIPVNNLHSFSNDPFITISVFGKDNSQPVPHAEVNLISSGGILVQYGITRHDGKVYFSTKNLPTGKYIVKVYSIKSAVNILKKEIEIDYKGFESDNKIFIGE